MVPQAGGGGRAAGDSVSLCLSNEYPFSAVELPLTRRRRATYASGSASAGTSRPFRLPASGVKIYIDTSRLLSLSARLSRWEHPPT